ncbi:hypothetical protein V3C99_009938 [Haemonchus contortus]|uniref:RNA-directed DNA polymerase n=1 Tax=Haemonchus contortus TaxID=6289 RepID=A0A7I4YJ35_HAECO
MTSEGTKFEWTKSRTDAFETMKGALTSTPVLAQPDIEGARSGARPLCIHTDASYSGVGAVLSQKGDDNFLHPIFFASKGLNKSERNYHITDLEALAVVTALRRFHMFVYGLPIHVYTDHQPLTALFTRSNLSARVLRWALELQAYNIKFVYVKGAANRVADALSRGAVDAATLEENTSIPNELIVASTTEEPEWTRELRQDAIYGKVITALEHGMLSEEVVFPNQIRKMKVADFMLQDGYLCVLDKENVRRVVPKVFRKQVFHDAHSALLAGHFGVRKVLRELSKRVFRENMTRDVRLWTEECKKCTLFNAQSQMTPPLKPISSTRPFEMIGVDLLEMGPTSSGNKYILSVIDHFTKFGGAYPVASKSAETIARTLFERWMADGCRIPKCILSDQGGEFDNKLMSELASIMGIRQIFTKGYNPREGESPFFLMHGFDAKVPWETVPEREVTPYMVDFDDYVQEVVAGTKIAWQNAREKNEKEREAMKKSYDRNHNVVANPLKTGDSVYMRVPTEKGNTCHPKLVNEWTGPFRVLGVSDNRATITAITGNKDPLCIPFDQLRKLPPGIDNEPVVTNRRRAKRGRPKKVDGRVSPNHTSFRAEVGDPRFDPLHLLYPCQCGIFNTRAQVGLPGLRCDLARSKPVKNLFEMANVASIALHPHWGEERKEAELLNKDSKYLTIHGLATAIHEQILL